MFRMKILTLTCTAFAVFANAEVVQPRILTTDEIAIYELLIGQYGGELVVSRDMISQSPKELSSIWKYITRSNGHMWAAFRVTSSVQTAFNDLITQSKSKWSIQSWTSRFPLQTGSLPDEQPPITIFQFSPIGFDSTKTVAVVIRSGQQGPDAGSTEMIILRKVDGVWKVEIERTYRMS
ncbi:hypothetical protein [Geothrix limicola]|uniref:hypothetical protein n=1 Tax=Geothrix limicola TaxID=2927978 RepID=UPI00255331F5|nr:hypothetical protein [Geothrix limicola]